MSVRLQCLVHRGVRIRPVRRSRGRRRHEFSSISFHRAFILAFFSWWLSRFAAWVFSRSCRRHWDTACLAPLHMPIDRQRNPRAWHSSKAATMSSQPVPRQVRVESEKGEEGMCPQRLPIASFRCRCGCIVASDEAKRRLGWHPLWGYGVSRRRRFTSSLFFSFSPPTSGGKRSRGLAEPRKKLGPPLADGQSLGRNFTLDLRRSPTSIPAWNVNFSPTSAPGVLALVRRHGIAGRRRQATAG